jgi:hypothetical protein
MGSRIVWMCIALVAIVSIGAWLRLSSDAQRTPATAEERVAPATAAPRNSVSAGGPRMRPEVPSSLPTAAIAGVEPLLVDGPRVEQPEEVGFELDARGELIKNAQTRDEMERILNGDPDGLDVRRQEILERLPPAAAREALDLLDRFINYRQALRQAMPDTALALTEQDALVMLDTAHALRVSYFGEALTDAFFGAEEAIGRGTAQGILEAGSDAR